MQTLQMLEAQRPEQTQCAKDIATAFEDGNRVVAVVAPVKSGKSDIKIIFRLRNQSERTVHLYISSLNRKDEKEQIEKLEEYGFKIFKTNSKTVVDDLVETVRKLSRKVDDIYLHFNESDYGTSEGQSLGRRFADLLKFRKVRLICYSASNEELLCSEVEHAVVTYHPHENYRGAEYYLSAGLVHEADEFWDEEFGILSRQAVDNIQKLVKAPNKIFGVVRFAGRNELETVRASGDFADAVKGLGITHVKYITGKADEFFDWGLGHYHYLGLQQEGQTPKVLLVLNKTCARSTEVKFHRLIDFWHDYRGDKTPYNTAIQAFGRPFHYATPNAIPHNIRVYAQTAVFELAAGRISMTQYERKLSTRVKAESSLQGKFKYFFYTFNAMPTAGEIDEAFAKHNAVRNGKVTKFTLSRHTTDDLIPAWLGGQSRSVNRRVTYDTVLYLDKPAAVSKVSWATYVVPKRMQGKFILVVPAMQDEEPTVKHSTTKKSMYK